ncbi:nitroreductase family protein [Candidatus Woesearchaeota archaeon]|nr:nitroreductase family protein [Candidatus Woesearchaeota archaeon]
MEGIRDEVKSVRKPGWAINPIFVNRWSPRAMTGEELPDEELMPLFEAARWAPSSFNEQPWRFIIAKRNTPDFGRFLQLLTPGNQAWCSNAAVLLLIVSKKTLSRNDAPNRVHDFDAGSAWMSMALEGTGRGLVVHGMGGFDRERARTEIKVPDDYDVEAMVAIGRRKPDSQLTPEEKANQRISDRRPVEESVFKGSFGKNIRA